MGGRFNKEGNLTMLAMGGCKMSSSLHLPPRILKVYTEALTGFSHAYSPDGLNNTILSQSCVLEGLLGRQSRWYMHSEDRGGGEKSLIAQGPAFRSTSSHVLTVTSSNKCMINVAFQITGERFAIH